jgi:hypothetical protein
MEQKDNSLEIKPTKRRDRSTPFPSVTLSEAIDLVKELNETMGVGPHKRSAVAVGIGYKSLSGTAASKIAALTHYGLITKSGDSYTLSDISTKILFPRSDQDIPTALKDAAMTPSLFLKLHSKYKGEQLPKLLPNILHTEYSVSQKASTEATEIFKDTMRFAGLLDSNGILRTSSLEIPPQERSKENSEAREIDGGEDVADTNSTSANNRRVLEGSGWKVIIATDFKLTKKIKLALRDLEDALDDINQDHYEEE